MNNFKQQLNSLLGFSGIYDCFQKIMGGHRARHLFANEYLKASENDIVLDIGCATAEILDYLPPVKYYGFDTNAGYINKAKSKYVRYPNAVFQTLSVEQASEAGLPKADIAMAIGVIHHLNDSQVLKLFNFVSTSLKPAGRFVSIDPVIVDEQSFIARMLVANDRGDYVREKPAYLELAKRHFANVGHVVRHDINRFPYTHLILECHLDEAEGSSSC